MKTLYVLIKTKISKFNANSGFYTIGLPSMTAFAGAFHNIQRKINEKIGVANLNKELTICGFSIACKNVLVREGHPRYINATKGSDPKKNASSIDEKNGDGEFAFILQIKHNLNADNFEDLELADDEPLLQLFKQLLNNCKIAGGNLSTPYISISSDFFEVNKFIKYKNYFYITDESSLVSKDKTFSDFIDFIARPIFNLDMKIEQKPFYIPLAVGYRLLENPKLKNKNNNTLRNNEFLHAYAEPVLSLGRLQKVTSILFNLRNETEKEIPKIFWNYEIKNNLYLITAQTNI